MQNGVSKGTLRSAVEGDHSRALVYHHTLHALPDLMLFMHNLGKTLDAHPEVKVSSSSLPISKKHPLKQTLVAK